MDRKETAGLEEGEFEVRIGFLLCSKRKEIQLGISWFCFRTVESDEDSLGRGGGGSSFKDKKSIANRGGMDQAR